MFTIHITLNSGEKETHISTWFQLVPNATRPRIQFYVVTKEFVGQIVRYLDEIQLLDIKEYVW